jgi:chaperone required for assembly of F1-ATPase
MTDWDLGGLSAVVRATGSLSLGLAVAAGRLSGDEAWRLSQIDETYQGERWGEIDEATARRRRIRDDIEAATRFLSLGRV